MKAMITCALTGVLTDPDVHNVPVTPEQMAEEARRAYDAGASIVHCHFRQQEPGMGRLPSWDPDVAGEICEAIRDRCPDILINMSTGVMGADISEPVSCLERVRPEMAALNAGSLNYLKARRNGTWAWPPPIEPGVSLPEPRPACDKRKPSSTSDEPTMPGGSWMMPVTSENWIGALKRESGCSCPG